jgi:hypothetical protein
VAVIGGGGTFKRWGWWEVVLEGAGLGKDRCGSCGTLVRLLVIKRESGHSHSLPSSLTM